MADKIYIEPLGDMLDVMNKSSEIYCLPIRTDCTPYLCDGLVKGINDQWATKRHTLCNCSKAYFLHYPQGETLTFQVQFPQNESTSVVVKIKDCNHNEIPFPPNALAFQVNSADIQNFALDTSLITADLTTGWYLCFEHLDNEGGLLDCCFTEKYAPFEIDETVDCQTKCTKGKNYIKLEGCNKNDCCGTVYGELGGSNFGSNIIHYPIMWIEGFTKKEPYQITNEFYGSKSTKGTKLEVLTIQLGKDGLPCFAHNMLGNLLFGGKVKVNEELYMIESFTPDKTNRCEYHFRYAFQVTRQCEIVQC